MSAHADANEIMGWLGGFTAAPKQTFIVHGEPTAQDTLGARIKAELGWSWKAPTHQETLEFVGACPPEPWRRRSLRRRSSEGAKAGS